MQETHITRVHQLNTKSSQLGAQKNPIGHQSALKDREVSVNDYIHFKIYYNVL